MTVQAESPLSRAPRARTLVRAWLLTGAVLIAAMVTIGGVTRLTGSGLSIPEWDLIMGTLPPLSDAAWAELFAKYQATPQYALVNTHFSLPEFKAIFWWEYVHRLLGRLLGLIFLIPFVIFVARGWLRGATLRAALLIFGLGAFQGVLGWLMVASGLVDRPAVSHYRLAAHLMTALLTFSVTLWTWRSLAPGAAAEPAPRRLRWLLVGFTVLLTLQVTYGAFVAGLRAGFIFNTFPTMEGAWIPGGMTALRPALRNLTENPVMVQWIHRLLAWMLVGAAPFLTRALRRGGLTAAGNGILAAVALQFLLGMGTIVLLPARPVFWGTLHQAGAVVLITVTVLSLHAVRGRPRLA